LSDAKEKRKDRFLSYELGMLNFELNLKPKLGNEDTKRGRLELSILDYQLNSKLTTQN